MPGARPVRVVSVGLYGPGPYGRVVGFDPVVAGVPRKHLKTMTRAVQLGVAAVQRALAGVDLAAVPPERRGLYVGASPQVGDAEDIEHAVLASGATLSGFVERGIPLIPPLWLVKGLSNNILGYASAQHDLRGDNGNWCDGRLSGSVAVGMAAAAVADGRVDLAVAGGADCLVGAEGVVGGPCAEGAAFLVLLPGEGEWGVQVGPATEEGSECTVGELGAAAIPVALALAYAEGLGVRAGGIWLEHNPRHSLDNSGRRTV